MSPNTPTTANPNEEELSYTRFLLTKFAGEEEALQTQLIMDALDVMCEANFCSEEQIKQCDAFDELILHIERIIEKGFTPRAITCNLHRTHKNQHSTSWKRICARCNMPKRRTWKQRAQCPQRKEIQKELQTIRDFGFIIQDMLCLFNEKRMEQVLSVAGPLREEYKHELL